MLTLLKKRFEANVNRHSGLSWEDVEAKLMKSSESIKRLHWMEETGGEPDVIDYDPKTQRYLFVDCSAQSPEGRRSLCYDQEALDARKENKPKSSAQTEAFKNGVQLLTEDHYRTLQTLGEFDTKTSSWIETPEAIRKEGGALFCDRRYKTVFTYHNGADSYYSARGFRVYLWI